LRVGDQIAEVYRFHRGAGRKEAARRAAEALAKVAMPDPDDIMRRYPHQLSGGQQQRVVIAMALAGGPRLLLLDEPTTGLDVTIEAEIIDLIAALRAEIDASILLISHNLGLVSRMCDRIGIIYAGRIVEEGPAHDLLHAPRHPYTMGLLRCVPRFEPGKGRVRLEPIPGALPFLGDAIAGCAFHPRCVLAKARCRGREPELYDVGPGRRSRCYFWEDVPQMPHTYPAAVRGTGGTSAETLLEVSGLRKSYHGRGGDTVAVDDVSLEVRKEETLGLVGESGSGKTTLARCLVGLTVPMPGRSSSPALRSPGRAAGAACASSRRCRWCSKTRRRRSTPAGPSGASSPGRCRCSCTWAAAPGSGASPSSPVRCASNRGTWTSAPRSCPAG